MAPVMDLTEKDMEKMSEELVEFHETFHDYTDERNTEDSWPI